MEVEVGGAHAARASIWLVDPTVRVTESGRPRARTWRDIDTILDRLSRST
jgi:hypothetical protein